MNRILSKPAIKHTFVKGLIGRPGVTLYRKSGTWRKWHADSVLVESKGYKFIVVALAAHRDGGQWLVKLIAPLHDPIVPRA